MSVIPNYKTVSKQDLRKVPKDFPDVVDFVLKAIDPLQKQIKDLTQAMQRGISFGDNVRCEIKENLNVSNGVAIEITLQTIRDPLGVFCVRADSAFTVKPEVVDAETIRVTFNFTGTATLIVLGR